MDILKEEIHNKYQLPIIYCDCVSCEESKKFNKDLNIMMEMIK